MTWSNTFEKINGRPNGVLHSPAVGPLVESCEYSIAKHSLGVGGVRLGQKLSEVTEVVRYIDRLSCFNSHTSTTPLLANDTYDHDFASTERDKSYDVWKLKSNQLPKKDGHLERYLAVLFGVVQIGLFATTCATTAKSLAEGYEVHCLDAACFNTLQFYAGVNFARVTRHLILLPWATPLIHTIFTGLSVLDFVFFISVAFLCCNLLLPFAYESKLQGKPTAALFL
ncbi:hypothetical protein B0J11DRAFT_513056 [Dendryphion nanum]|uniref:Uncharacterized protein n=1 Tax=Dendryphion nanum TaxID=256645 RepID=A0A9P9I5S8_9PLEO|nr:hypothetical protein B0J11DRAFT_513056 [Dendryphion nanum]